MEGDGNAEEVTLTAEDFLEQAEAAEQEADLVLGGDDGDKCTYPLGYLPRQAVFSCLTCTKTAPAGICVACALQCHDGHQVEEVYTRRNFRCDCGNSKFGEFACKLQNEKDSENAENIYNQNFSGAYCSCSRPYPDPERETAGLGEDMVQCCICEDWFHEEHLGLGPNYAIPVDEEGNHGFEELICPGCVDRCSFLALYPDLPVEPIRLEGNESEKETAKQFGNTQGQADAADSVRALRRESEEEVVLATASVVDVKTENGCSGVENLGKSEKIVVRVSEGAAKVEVTESTLATAETELRQSNGEERSIEGSGLAKECLDVKKPDRENNSSSCKVAMYKGADDIIGPPKSAGCAIFLPKGWRTELCTCSDCRSVYDERKVMFLFNELDTIAAYEENAKRKREGQPSSEDRAMNAFMANNGISHVQKMEMIHGFHELHAKMKEFLQPYSQTGEVVTRDAIVDFFADLTQKRRRIQ